MPPHLKSATPLETRAVTAAGAGGDVFLGDSPMARLMRAKDWAATPLGPVAGWPDGLKVALRILLTSRFDMWLGWGPDCAFFYNDAYTPTLGTKHPDALGMPTRLLWSEIWAEIEPRIRGVYERGEASWDRALPLLIERNGYPEETYHTFSYSPLLGDTGVVEGLLCVVSEETSRVTSERRFGSLRSLAAALAAATSFASVIEAARASLSTNRRDLPFSLTYLFGRDGAASLAFVTGIGVDHPAAPTHLRRDAPGLWPLDGYDTPIDVAAIAEISNLGELPTGDWARPPTQIVTVPLIGQGGVAPIGMMVVGLNPHREFDTEYLSFLHLIAGQVAAGIASAGAFEAERHRAETLATAVRMRQEAAEAMERANARLADEVERRTAERDQIWQASTDMLCVASMEGYFLSLNPAWAATLGWTDEAMMAQPFLALVHPDDADSMIAAAGGLASGAAQLSFENRYRHRDGSYRWFSWNAVPRDGLIYASVRDITEAKEAAWREQALEEQLRQSQKMEAVGQLTGGLAHDFNNLLTGITGSLDILGSRLAKGRHDDLDRFIDAAQDGAKRAAALTHRLLAFSRRQTLDPRATDANRLVSGMGDLLRRTVGPAVAVEIVAAPRLWTILVDPNQLENALLNLCINARDAMADGGRITIETRNAMLDATVAATMDVPPGAYVSLRVSDTGSGIPPEVVDRVFDPFFTTKPLGQGTGLGLSMIYGFVRQSGGQVGIDTAIGRGTTITLHLPRHDGAAAIDDTTMRSGDAPVVARGKTVLIVDDEPTVRMLVAEVLEDLGHRALEASDGRAGLALLRSDRTIDLLITDVGMPGGMNGRQLADAARALRPDLAVLFITGYAEQAVFGEGQLAPGLRILTKPFAMDALATIVSEMVGK